MGRLGFISTGHVPMNLIPAGFFKKIRADMLAEALTSILMSLTIPAI